MDELVELPGSGREPVAGARRVADAPGDEQVRLTVVVRRPPGARPPAAADPEDLARVRDFLTGAGIEVIAADAASRTISARTTVERATAAFGVRLGRFELEGAGFRGREGPLRVPAGVADAIVAVLGLDDRPQAGVTFRFGPPLPVEALPDPAGPPPVRARAAAPPKPAPLWTTQVARLYEFPDSVDGAGQTIAIIELGGGYRDAELAAYFAKAGVAAPQVTAVAVDQGANAPGGDADGEVLLDIEVAGTVAPASRIVVYFADNSDRGFFDALTRAIHAEPAPAAISISWGGPESSWTAQAMTAFDAATADAVALGVTVLAAAGDHGAGDAAGDGAVHADFPASSPHVVACGGTELIADGNAIAAETVWNEGDGWATGGGVSRRFPVPPYQQDVPVPDELGRPGRRGRGVPDVAGNASSRSGYIVLVDGQWTTVGGTSAVAPLYAGLVALLAEALGGAPPTLPAALYGADTYRDVAGGDNAVPATPDFGPAAPGYPAVAGWDACTGLGSIRGAALLAHLRGAPAPNPAGVT